MLPIQSLLGKFKNLTNNEKFKKQLVLEIFEKDNIKVSLKEIVISKNIIFLKTRPIIKTEILLKKNDFLNEVKKIPGLEYINDIK